MSEVSKVGVINPNAVAIKDDPHSSMRSYKIVSSTITTSLAFTTTFLSSATNTTGFKFLADSGVLGLTTSVFAANTNVTFRGISVEYQHTERMYWHQVFRHRILENFFHTNMFQTSYTERNVTIVRSPIRDEYNIYKMSIDRKKLYEFFPFKFDQINLKRQDEVNVEVGSQFTYTRPQQFEFSYVRGANNDDLNYGMSAAMLTKNDYEDLSRKYKDLFPDMLPDIETDPTVKTYDADKKSTGEKRYSDVGGDELFSQTEGDQESGYKAKDFAAAWMDRLAGPHYWVKFPVGGDLDAMLGTPQAALIKASGEYKMHTPFFIKLNNGDLAEIMNHPIPDVGKPLGMAIPLSKIPKDLDYNMKHHGILKVDFARGQRQQYNVITATGKVFVVGATHTYYTHNRKVINFLEYGEKHDVYKFFVHSTANYHFACKAPLPQPYGQPRPNEGTSVVNYRYEGNFNIEQVTADPWEYREANGANTSTGGKLNTYVQGIHGVKSAKLAKLGLRSPILELVATYRRAYEADVAHKKDAVRSELRLSPNGVFISVFPSGKDETPQAYISVQNKVSQLDLKSRSSEPGSKVQVIGEYIQLGGVKAIQVTGNTLFTGSVTIADDPRYKLTAKNVTLSKVKGHVMSDGTWNFS